MLPAWVNGSVFRDLVSLHCSIDCFQQVATLASGFVSSPMISRVQFWCLWIHTVSYVPLKINMEFNHPSCQRNLPLGNSVWGS